MNLRNLLTILAIMNGKDIPTPWEKKKQAGVDCFTGYLNCHPLLSIRKPEATSLTHTSSLNPDEEDESSFAQNCIPAAVQTKCGFSEHNAKNLN